MAKLVKKYKRKYRRNPDDAPDGGGVGILGAELLEMVGPAAASFVATRFATRIATVQIAKRWPRFAKHAGAAASVGSFLSAWLAGHKWKPIRKWHEPIVVGAGIAAVQSLIQIYFPKLGWAVSDASSQPARQIAAPPQQQQIAGGGTGGSVSRRSIPQEDPDYESIDEGGWFSYNDARSPGRYTHGGPHPAPQQSQQVDPEDDMVTNENDDAVFDALTNDSELQAAGIFG